MREAELLPPLVHHFESRGFRAFSEVPVAGRRADLVAVSDDAILAVEVKLSRWRQALRQAIAYELWADEAYVALPFPRALAALRHRHRFDAEGVGLLAVLDGDVRAFVPAAPSMRRFPALADLVRRQIAPPILPLEGFPESPPENVFMGNPSCSDGNPPANGTRFPRG